MKFKTLVIQNFTSYKDATLNLADRGLVLIEGRKNGIVTYSNGSGKTNLFECVLWVLFGRTYTKEVLANDVVFNQGKNCKVSIEIDNFIISRYRKHSKFKNELHLTIDGKDSRGPSDKETQEKINHLLGTSFEAFVNSVFLGQNVIKSFASATNTERKIILEKLLGNEKYQEILNDIIIPALRKTREKVEDLEDDLELTIKNRDRLSNRIEYLKEKNSTFEKEKRKKVEILKAKLNVEVKVDITSRRSPNELNEEIGRKETLLNNEGNSFQQDLQKIDRRILQLTKELSTLESEKRFIEREVDKLQTKLNVPFVELIGQTCPTCFKLIEEEDVSSYRNHIEEKIKKQREKKILGFKPLHGELKKREGEKKNILKKQEQQERLKEDIFNLKQELNDLAKEKEKEKAEKEKIRIVLEEAKNQSSPYPELISKEETEYDEVVKSEETILDNLSRAKEELPYLEMYESIFSRTGKKELPSIPSIRLDEIVPTLTESANKRLRQISDELVVSFDTTSTTQRGKVTDKFDVKVTNESGSNVYGGDSAGEKKLVDICIMLALGQIASTRNKNKIPILLLDELFGFLDEANSEKVMDLLRNEVKIKESVFVTTLNPEFSNMFENKIVIDKRGKESHLIDT